MARAIFINRFYWPDEPATAQLLTDLAERLAMRGLEIIVVTSKPRRADAPRRDARAGVEIIRVGSSRSASDHLAAKAWDFATFHVAAAWRLWRICRPGDAVVAMTDPPLLALGIWPIARWRSARLFHWVQDIYPELATALSGHAWPKAFLPLRNLAWRRAEACVTLGQEMAGVLSAAGVAPERINVIQNWAPQGLEPGDATSVAKLRSEWGLEGRFIVEYSGNLGRVHDLDPVLRVARELQKTARVQILLVGNGARRIALETAVRGEERPNIHFRAPQPRSKLAESLSVGHLHLVTVLPGCERYVYPSKLHGILTIGRPVLFIGPADCEIARLIAARGLGLAFERSNITGIAQAIAHLAAHDAEREAMAKNARRFAEESGGLDAAAEAWHKLLATPKPVSPEKNPGFPRA